VVVVVVVVVVVRFAVLAQGVAVRALDLGEPRLHVGGDGRIADELDDVHPVGGIDAHAAGALEQHDRLRGDAERKHQCLPAIVTADLEVRRARPDEDVTRAELGTTTPVIVVFHGRMNPELQSEALLALARGERALDEGGHYTGA